MDVEKRRLSIGCRKPPELIVMDADDGKILAGFPIGAGVSSGAYSESADSPGRQGQLE